MMYQPYPGPVRGYPGGAPYMVPPQPPQQQQQPPVANEVGTEGEESGDGAPVVEGEPGVEAPETGTVTEEPAVPEGDGSNVPDATSTSASGSSGTNTPSTQGQQQQAIQSSQGLPQQPQQMYNVNQYYPAPQTMNPVTATTMGRGGVPNQGNVYPGMTMMGRGYHPGMMGGPQQTVCNVVNFLAVFTTGSFFNVRFYSYRLCIRVVCPSIIK